MGPVLDEIPGIASFAKFAGPEKREERPSGPERLDQGGREHIRGRRNEVIEHVPAQHGVDALAELCETPIKKLRESMERGLIRVTVEVGIQVLHVNLAAKPLPEKRDVRADRGSELEHLRSRSRRQEHEEPRERPASYDITGRADAQSAPTLTGAPLGIGVFPSCLKPSTVPSVAADTSWGRMSMLPRNFAPSAIATRGATTSPSTDPFSRMSTFSYAVRLPVTCPTTTIDFATTCAWTCALGPT